MGKLPKLLQNYNKTFGMKKIILPSEIAKSDPKLNLSLLFTFLKIKSNSTLF